MNNDWRHEAERYRLMYEERDTQYQHLQWYCLLLTLITLASLLWGLFPAGS